MFLSNRKSSLTLNSCRALKGQSGLKKKKLFYVLFCSEPCSRSHSAPWRTLWRSAGTSHLCLWTWPFTCSEKFWRRPSPSGSLCRPPLTAAWWSTLGSNPRCTTTSGTRVKTVSILYNQCWITFITFLGRNKTLQFMVRRYLWPQCFSKSSTCSEHVLVLSLYNRV